MTLETGSLRRLVHSHIEISQHIGWLKMYAESMTAENWKDMRDRILHQTNELSSRLGLPPNGENGDGK